jgi:4'-phosphopantetheinyl transferase
VPIETSNGNRGRLVVSWSTVAASIDELLARFAASFADVEINEVRVVRACRSCGSDQHGKPYVLGLDAVKPIHVSLSRAGQLVAVAVSDAGPVGVDVEGRHVARGRTALSPDVATWVRKESVVKATGHGLMIDPELIDVTAPGSAPALLAWPSEEPLESPVWMFDVECPEGFVAAATVLANAQPHLVTVRAAPGD